MTQQSPARRRRGTVPPTHLAIAGERLPGGGVRVYVRCPHGGRLLHDVISIRDLTVAAHVIEATWGCVTEDQAVAALVRIIDDGA